MDDFSFDFTVYNKYNHVFSNDPAENTLIKCYLSEHQFSEDVNLAVKDIINILSLFLEEDEEVYVNSVRRKIYLKIKNGLETGLKDKLINIFQFMGFKVVNIKIDDKSIEIEYKDYADILDGEGTYGMYR